MSATLPIDVYEVFEDTFGKEGAHKVVKSFEAIISDATDYKWKVTRDELLDAIRKEFVTKDLFEEKINTLRVEMQAMRMELLGEMKKDKAELLGKIGELYGKSEKDKMELEGKIIGLEGKIIGLEGKMENIKMGLDGRIDKINQTLWFMIVLMIIALTLMNPVVAEIIKGLLKI